MTSKQSREDRTESGPEVAGPSGDTLGNPSQEEKGKLRPRGPDRRLKQTNPISWHSLLHGRRRRIRRIDDRKIHYYVDRYGPVSVTLFLAALLLSLLDAFITIRLLQAGGVELNPVMHFLLQFGEGPFLFGKFGCTAVALLVLLIHKEYRFGRRSFRSRNLLVVALGVYALLIVYEIALLSKI